MKTRKRRPGKRRKEPLPLIGPTTPYSLNESAALLKIDKRKVRRLMDEGRIKGRQEGNRCIILGEELLAYLRNGGNGA